MFKSISQRAIANLINLCEKCLSLAIEIISPRRKSRMIANEQMLSGKIEKKFYTNISRLRAIENGKFLVKSSNTGFTGLINEKGETVFKLAEDKFGIAKIVVPLTNEKTFYTKHSYHINLFILLQGIILIIYCISLIIRDMVTKRNFKILK